MRIGAEIMLEEVNKKQTLLPGYELKVSDALKGLYMNRSQVMHKQLDGSFHFVVIAECTVTPFLQLPYFI